MNLAKVVYLTCVRDVWSLLYTLSLHYPKSEISKLIQYVSKTCCTHLAHRLVPLGVWIISFIFSFAHLPILRRHTFPILILSVVGERASTTHYLSLVIFSSDEGSFWATSLFVFWFLRLLVIISKAWCKMLLNEKVIGLFQYTCNTCRLASNWKVFVRIMDMAFDIRPVCLAQSLTEIRFW